MIPLIEYYIDKYLIPDLLHPSRIKQQLYP